MEQVISGDICGGAGGWVPLRYERDDPLFN
jgi:hypothetical protein